MTKLSTGVLALLTGFVLGAAVVHGVHAQAKPQAYTIAEFEVTDPETFKKYGDATRTAIPAAGGRFIVRAGAKAVVVNGAPPKQVAVIQWESLDKGQAFFESEAYKQLIPVRDKGSRFRAFTVEGAAP
jgi:uncharacterized protein (DUF1330 family)